MVLMVFPIEFNKKFQEVLINPLLMRWEEAISYGAFPKSINEGMIQPKGERYPS